MTETDHAREAILEQAATWCATLRMGNPSLEERAAFLAWLKRSPTHIEEYLGIVAAAQVLADEARRAPDRADELNASNPRLADDNVIPFALDETVPLTPEAPARNTGWLTVLLGAAAVCIAVLMLGVFAYTYRESLQFGFGETYRTAQSQQGAWRLLDDSVLFLNANSAATVRFTDKERLVEVRYGQVMFRVAHENARRFRVISGAAQVIAVGTEFDVLRQDDSTRITLLEGRIAVLKDEVPSLATPALEAQGAVALEAGEQIVVNPASISRPRKVDFERAGAWLQRRMVFKHDALHKVVAEFNRYSRVPLRIADQSLGNLEISGSFNTYDLESFLEFVRRLDGVAVETTPEAIYLRKRSKPDSRPLTIEP